MTPEQISTEIFEELRKLPEVQRTLKTVLLTHGTCGEITFLSGVLMGMKLGRLSEFKNGIH